MSDHQAPGAPAGPQGLDDAAVARRVADAAGRALLAVRAEHAGASDLKARGDRGAQEVIAAELAALRPQDAVLSEEAVDDPARLDAERVWIVDPLDGTREFGEGDRHDWAVHVALWERGDLVAGAVALPALGRTLVTSDVGAPWREAPLEGRRPRLAVSRSRATDVVTGLARALGLDLVPLGSAGYKTSAVVLGEVDAYVHTGGQYEWDSAAPVAVARAAGLFTSRVDGSPLTYNRRDPLLPDLVVCRPELSDAILDHLSQTTTERETA
ncbi:3'(2'),5'-bisphosphate nucleotidase CysQ [Vallicoccus soli]|uniref:3'(2'),5'-bisphosphate nucleotidase CysQ n=1 Tax=Vallicoccus soli TaxID=2339232 RepID=A0A3A3ZNB6_9ACTN|nr:3'(2'),5'-bisphosphate nucleotidase CysQ [Vallicoccus soli]